MLLNLTSQCVKRGFLVTCSILINTKVSWNGMSIYAKLEVLLNVTIVEQLKHECGL